MYKKFVSSHVLTLNFILNSNQNYSFIYSFLLFLRLNYIIILALNFIQFYRFSIEANLSRKKIIKMFNVNDFTIPENEKSSKISIERNNEWNVLWSDHFIEFKNLIDSSSKEQFDFFFKKVTDFKNIETNVKNKIISFFDQYVFINDLKTFNAFCDIDELDHSISENHEIFSILKKLLFDAEK